MKFNFSSYKSLLVVDKRLTKELFIENAGLHKGKFAADLFSRMYDWVFSEAIFLEDDYILYYKVEYQNFEDFIYKKFCINKDSLKMMFKLKDENENYTIIAFNELSTGYDGFINFVFSDEFYDRFINYFLMKKNEN